LYISSHQISRKPHFARSLFSRRRCAATADSARTHSGLSTRLSTSASKSGLCSFNRVTTDDDDDDDVSAAAAALTYQNTYGIE
jgi:hypothetical protein